MEGGFIMKTQGFALVIAILVVLSMGFNSRQDKTVHCHDTGTVSFDPFIYYEQDVRDYRALMPDIDGFSSLREINTQDEVNVLIEIKGLDPDEEQMMLGTAKTYILQIPESLRSDFTRRKFKLNIMSPEAYKQFWREEWESDTSSYACYSSTRSRIMTTDVSLKTLAHEFGHHLFTFYGDIQEYEPIYRAELDMVCELVSSDYGRTNISEGFAEAYSCYITNRKALAGYAPRTFAYIERAMGLIPIS